MKLFCYTILCISLSVASAARVSTQRRLQDATALAVKKHTESDDVAKGYFGCSSQTTCGGCLAASPKMTMRSDTFCKWCPQEWWYGMGSAYKRNATGVCRQSSSKSEICGGGSKWITYNGGKAGGEKAPDVEVATAMCPKGEAPVLSWERTKLQQLKARQLQEPRLLAISMLLLNLDIDRLNRFHATHPLLFDALMYKSKSQVAANYAWKVTVWGSTWIPIVGGAISLGLGIATSASEYGVDVFSTMVEAQQRTQASLCSKGRKASLEYFLDVTYGLLQTTYQKILDHENITDLEHKHKKTIANAKTGARLGAADEILSSGYSRVGKVMLHSGLFVGGFFTFGLTWLISAGIGLAEMSVEWSTAWAAAAHLEDKTLLLVDLARQADQSEWLSEKAIKCSITDWDRGVNPCPDRVINLNDKEEDKADDEGEETGEEVVNDEVEEDEGAEDEGSAPVRTFGKRAQGFNGGTISTTPLNCVRSSPWGFHEEVVPRAEFGADGICVPRARAGLEDGLPCVTHQACSSSYCHFDPRQMYFFSDHERKFCASDDQHCTPLLRQLHTLQMSQVDASEETIAALGKFTGVYKGSYHSPMYATTGTCATPCLAKDIGRGNCGAIAAGAAEMAGSTATKYDFGVRQTNRVFVDDNHGYELVGHGHCGTTRDMQGEGFRTLQSHVEVDVPYDEEDFLQFCAKECFSNQLGVCRSFSVYRRSGACRLHLGTADVAPKLHGEGPEGHAHTSCYSLLQWPQDGYQPWNMEWSNYRMDLDSLVGGLESQDDVTADVALRAVRAAYKDFCKGHDECPHPDEWDADDASRMLRFTAPLSAEQLRTAHEFIDPGSTEQPAKPGQKIKIRAMLQRRHGFGEGWRQFFLHQNDDSIIAEVVSYDKMEPEHSSAALPKYDLGWVQQIEAQAVQKKLRTPADEWDLVAADALVAGASAGGSESP